MMWSTTLKISVMVLFVLTMYAVIFHADFVSHAVDAVKNILTVERDPLPRDRSFFEMQRDIMRKIHSFNDSVSTAVRDYHFIRPGRDPPPENLCFGVFDQFDVQTFSSYFLVLRKEGSGMAYEVYDSSLAQIGAELGVGASPSYSAFYEGVVPCVVYGRERVNNFYTDFLASKEDFGKIDLNNYSKYSLEVDKIVFNDYGMLWFPIPEDYDGHDNDKKSPVKTDVEGIIVTEFEYGEDFGMYYFLKHGECFSVFPTRNENILGRSPFTVGRGCDTPSRLSPFSPARVVTDVNCLDIGSGARKLPNRIQEALEYGHDWRCPGSEARLW